MTHRYAILNHRTSSIGINQSLIGICGVSYDPYSTTPHFFCCGFKISCAKSKTYSDTPPTTLLNRMSAYPNGSLIPECIRCQSVVSFGLKSAITGMSSTCRMFDNTHTEESIQHRGFVSTAISRLTQQLSHSKSPKC